MQLFPRSTGNHPRFSADNISLLVALFTIFQAVLMQTGCGSGESDSPGTGATAGTTSGGTTAAAGTGVAGSGTAGTGMAGSGTAGSGTAGSGTAGSGTAGGTSAGFSISVSLSPEIATVGIVTWSIDEAIDSAYIDFGRESGNYEYRAPVDLAEPEYRTLLLGMKPGTTYYLQVVAQGAGGTFTSAEQTIETGFLPNGLPVMTIDDIDRSALYADGGFNINCTGIASGGGMFGGGGGAGQSYAFVFDKDGDEVWAFDLSDTVVAGCSSARMSYDGRYMWAGNFSNVSPDGALLRVSLDGLEQQDYSLPGRNHDFGVLPNNHILYWEQQNGGGYTNNSEGPDSIMELDPETGQTTEIYDEMTDFSVQINESGAHTNQANYVPDLDAISFSMRHTNTIGLISYPEGQLLAVFGGPLSTFDISWTVQHGHEVTGDHLLVFNNNGSNGGSSVLGFEYDLNSGTANQFLDYNSGNVSNAFGDVRWLPNGNIFITYSTSGVMHEITGTGDLLREVTSSDSLGYSEHRGTLYGPPPPFDR